MGCHFVPPNLNDKIYKFPTVYQIAALTVQPDPERNVGFLCRPKFLELSTRLVSIVESDECGTIHYLGVPRRTWFNNQHNTAFLH
jgi:hypothetical protein